MSKLFKFFVPVNGSRIVQAETLEEACNKLKLNPYKIISKGRGKNKTYTVQHLAVIIGHSTTYSVTIYPVLGKGTKILITDKKLPNYNEEGFIVELVPNSTGLYKWRTQQDIDEGNILCKNAGISQFKIIKT
tara:strand:- start:49 stop:444 length:396 start_codon:yes stop_codon:yes gene_type:complete